MQVGDTVTFTGQAERLADGRTLDVDGAFTVVAIDDSQADPPVTLRDVRVDAGAEQSLVDGNTYTVASSTLNASAAAAADDPYRAAFVAGAQWMGSQLLPADSPLLQLDDQAVDAALAAAPAPAGPAV